MAKKRKQKPKANANIARDAQTAHNTQTKNAQTKNTQARNTQAKAPKERTNTLKTTSGNQNLLPKAGSKSRKKSIKLPARKSDIPKAQEDNPEDCARMSAQSPAQASARRLEKHGFHPMVTTLTLHEYFKAWMEMKATMESRPKLTDTPRHAVAGLSTRQITMATLIFHPEFVRKKILDREGTTKLQGSLSLLLTDFAGPVLAESIFSNGIESVRAVALSNVTMWGIMTQYCNILDFTAGIPHSETTRSGNYIVVSPEYTVGDFHRSRDLDPLLQSHWNPVQGWYNEAVDAETRIYSDIQQLHRGFRDPNEAPELEERFGVQLHQVIRCLESTDDIFMERQFILGRDKEVFEPQQGLLASHVQRMVAYFHSNSKSVKVLHFEKVAFLDRRLLAVLIRGCPNITMIGVYDCPLIHFGDIVCLLDLIWEINEERRAQNKPLIHAFDFYPRYEAGMRYRHDNAVSYGVSWQPMNLSVIQRGLYTIIMKAFLKARAMKLGVLFDKDGAFMNYLFKLPNLPFGVPSFLDALYRLVELSGNEQDVAQQRKEAVFDLINTVRLSVGKEPQQGGAKLHNPEKDLKFCASCGYEMDWSFFHFDSIDAGPGARMCGGCRLQTTLDHIDNHQLVHEKRGCLDTLFPRWNGSGFNKEAPIPTKGKVILRLRTTKTQAAPPPLPVAGLNGHRIRAPQYERELVRNRKLHLDSLQNLPSLADLAGEMGAQWDHFHHESRKLDILCRSLRMIVDQARRSPMDLPPEVKKLIRFGKPDHYEEGQARRVSKYEFGQMSHDFESALFAHLKLVKEGLQPGKSPAALVDGQTLQRARDAEIKAFW